MKIGIIGAGNIGGTLTRRLTALEHAVWVANSRGPETLRDLAVQTGASSPAAPSPLPGAWWFLTLPTGLAGRDRGGG
ncbi:MAG: NAD(P)-binding domain-containing protein [Pseudonocardiaceae bacterium]